MRNYHDIRTEKKHLQFYIHVLYSKVVVTFTFTFQCGIVLADTPGIGENEFLETYLMEYISENNILGFIYIIFSDSAGGVQEDRVSRLSKYMTLIGV